MYVGCNLHEFEKVFHNGSEMNEEVICNSNWSVNIVYAQKLDRVGYSASLPLVPTYNCTGRDIHMVWLLSSLLAQMKEIWSKTTCVGMSKSYWHGWLLMHLSKNALGESMGHNPMCPYNMVYVNEVQGLGGKVNKGKGAL